MAGFIRKKKRGKRTASKSGAVLDARVIEQFKKARERKNLSQGELAKLVGTKQSAISRFESGRYNPSVEFLVKVADSLGKRIIIRLK